MFSVLPPRYFYDFVSSFTVVLSDNGIVMDEADAQAFATHYLREVLPQFLATDYFERQAQGSADEECRVSCLIFYNNVLLFLLEKREEEDEALLGQLLQATATASVLAFALRQMFDAGVCDVAYDAVTQLIRTTEAFGYRPSFLAPLFDQFIEDCFQDLQGGRKRLAEADLSAVVRLTLKLFQAYPDQLRNVDKAVLLSLEFLAKDSDSLNPVLVGFRKFVKRLCFDPQRTRFVPFLNLLWKRLPAVVELDKAEFAANERMLADPRNDFDSEQSLFDYLHVRKNAARLAKYLVYFLDCTDILPVMLAEVERLLAAKDALAALESLCFFFASLFGVVKPRSLRKDGPAAKRRAELATAVLSHGACFAATVRLYALLFPLLTSCASLQVRVDVLQASRKALGFLNGLHYFLDDGHFQAFRQLAEQGPAGRGDLLGRALSGCLVAYFGLVDRATLFAHQGFFMGLVLAKDVDSRLFEVAVRLVVRFSGEDAVAAVCKSVVQSFEAEPANWEREATVVAFVAKLNSLLRVCPPQQASALFAAILESMVRVNQRCFSNDFVSERLCQLAHELFKRASQSPHPDRFLACPALQQFLRQALDSFGKTYLPSYVYIFEALTNRFYAPEHFATFRFFAESVSETVVRLVEPGSWDRGCVVVGTARVPYAEKFSFLFDHGGLELGDLLNDYFGFLSQAFRRDKRLFTASAHCGDIVRLLANTFDHSFVFTVKSMPDVLVALLAIVELEPDGHLSESWQQFWFHVIEKAVCFVFEEYLHRDEVDKLVLLLRQVNVKFGADTFARTQQFVGLIPNTVLTQNEKNQFLQLLTEAECSGSNRNDDL